MSAGPEAGLARTALAPATATLGLNRNVLDRAVASSEQRRRYDRCWRGEQILAGHCCHP